MDIAEDDGARLLAGIIFADRHADSRETALAEDLVRALDRAEAAEREAGELRERVAEAEGLAKSFDEEKQELVALLSEAGEELTVSRRNNVRLRRDLEKRGERNEKLTEALRELIAATANVSAQFPARDRARAALTLEEGS